MTKNTAFKSTLLAAAIIATAPSTRGQAIFTGIVDPAEMAKAYSTAQASMIPPTPEQIKYQEEQRQVDTAPFPLDRMIKSEQKKLNRPLTKDEEINLTKTVQTNMRETGLILVLGSMTILMEAKRRLKKQPSAQQTNVLN